MTSLLNRSQIKSPTILFFTSNTDLKKLNNSNLTEGQKRRVLIENTIAKREKLRSSLKSNCDSHVNFIELDDGFSITISGDENIEDVSKALYQFNINTEIIVQKDEQRILCH